MRGRRRGAGQDGQALPLALATATVLVLGVVALFALGRAQLAAAQAQTAADVAALSAGRELSAHLGEITLGGPQDADLWRGRLARAGLVALARLGFPAALGASSMSPLSTVHRPSR